MTDKSPERTNDGMTDRKKTVLTAIINTVLFAFLILFHYSGADIKIFDANPMGALALLVAFVMFSSESAGVITGMIIGVIIDSVSSTPIGFNTITLTLISFGATFISHYLFNRNLKSALVLCLLCSAAYFTARWLICFAFAGDVVGSFTYLLRYGAGSAIYTTVFVIPFFYLEKKLLFKAR